MTKFCETTRCEVERDACWEDIEDCENSCLSGSIDSFEWCYEACRSIDCPTCAANDECAVFGYRFEVFAEPDPNIEAACARAAARDHRCSETTVDARCTHFARVENARAVAAYDCVTASACGDDVSACLEVLPSSDFGRRLCARLGVCSSDYCDSGSVASLDDIGRWLRSEVVAAALECLNEGCAHADACLGAWAAAVFPPG